MSKMSWRLLAAKLSELDEATVHAMLQEEMEVHRRAGVARRLHQRFSALRAQRERAELMGRLKR